MCGRITQHRARACYAEAVGFDLRNPLKWQGGDRIAQYNISRGSWPWVLHTLQGVESIDTVNWGYRPPWAVEKKIPLAINAGIEKASTGAYFRHMWKSGRVIVPADGWFEWIGEPKHTQPWYIRLKTDEPMFIAAISNWIPYKEGPAGTGFVIVTAAAEAGLVDLHDRRPVVFSARDARAWMDNTLPTDRAVGLARNGSLPPDAFEWFPVSTHVNQAGNNDPRLIDPV